MGPMIGIRSRTRGGPVEISRLNAGVILLVTGVLLTLAYYFISTTDAGSIMEMAGAGFMFIFLGALAILGEAFGIAPDGGK